MADNRIIRERTDRGTTFTFPRGTKISFSDVAKSELHEALERLYTYEQAQAEGRLIMLPRTGDDIGSPYVFSRRNGKSTLSVERIAELLEGGTADVVED